MRWSLCWPLRRLGQQKIEEFIRSLKTINSALALDLEFSSLSLLVPDLLEIAQQAQTEGDLADFGS